MTEETKLTIEYQRQRRKPVNRSGRCVQCSRPKESHAEDGTCRGGHGRYATMALAPGVTCADCAHVERCCAIFGQLPEDESCQFYPIRFRPLPVAAMEVVS
jgi:hypothetical protein